MAADNVCKIGGLQVVDVSRDTRCALVCAYARSPAHRKRFNSAFGPSSSVSGVKDGSSVRDGVGQQVHIVSSVSSIDV